MFSKKNKESIFIKKQSLLFQNEIKNSENCNENDLAYRVKEDRLAVIEASAGTGKTFALVELVLELMLEQEIPLKKILLVTFTEKATSELKFRLRTKFHFLLEAFDQKDDSLRKIPEGPFWEINSLRKNLLRAALLDFESAQIYTIHGFCKRILSEFAFENRQLFKQEFFDTKILFQEVFSKYVRTNFLSKKSYISELFSIYVKKNDGNLDNLREEILSLLNKEGQFVPKFPLFGDFISDFKVCFKKLISKDLSINKNKLEKHPILNAYENIALNKTSKEKIIRNLKNILKILQNFKTGMEISEVLPKFLEIELSIITKPKLNKNLKQGEKWLSLQELPKLEFLWIDALRECENLIKRNYILGDAKKIFKAWLIQNVIKDIRLEISKQKMERGIFDFDDLLSIVENEINNKNKNKSELSPLTVAVRKKYSCAIVDEFQDTDRRQWAIFSHFFMDSPIHRLTLIGDPKQSIYSFRGADIFTYLKAKKNILEKASNSLFVLKKNFRSSEKMIAGLNNIFGSDMWFPENQGIIYQNVSCGNLELDLEDKCNKKKAIHLLKLTPKFIISAKKIEHQKLLKNPRVSNTILSELESLSGEIFYSKDDFLSRINSVLGEDVVSKNSSKLLNLFLEDNTKNGTTRIADAISLEIKNLLGGSESSNSPTIWKDEFSKSRTINENDICILFRKTSEGEIMSKSLRKFGIDFLFYKQKGLFSGREAIEILDLLKAIANPLDFSRLGKLWLTRFFEVNLDSVSKFELINSKVFNQLQEWNSLAENKKFGELFQQILNITKLIERELFFGGNERSVTNYLHLFEFLTKKISERNLDLFELIQLLKGYIAGKEVVSDSDDFLRVESERKAVQLMTMHASKGLEFTIVFLFGGFSGGKRELAKFYYNLEDQKQIIDLVNSEVPEEYKWQEKSEQKRLLYVAMTRARGRLYLPYISSLSSDSNRRILRINGIYSILNETLTNIISNYFKNKENIPFSISISKILENTKKVNFEENNKNKIREWFPIEMKGNSNLLRTKYDQEKMFEKLLRDKRGAAVSSFSKLKKKEKVDGKKTEFIEDFPTLEYFNENELSKFRENDEIFKKDVNEGFDEKIGLSLIKNDDLKSSKFVNRGYELSGGVKMGNLIHDLLENLDFSSIRSSKSVDEWTNESTIRRFFESFNNNYGFPNSDFYPIAKIIWKTLRTKIKLGNSPESPVIELASIKKDLREVDFYFPIPNFDKNSKELFGAKTSSNDCWSLKRGFLRGSIDYIFEHQGRIYFIDWKSNILNDYGAEAIKKVVIKDYNLQLQIYTLATCYWFKINSEEKYKKRFGGATYLFVRGIKKHSYNEKKFKNSGVFFMKPSWKELLDFEKNFSMIKI